MTLFGYKLPGAVVADPLGAVVGNRGSAGPDLLHPAVFGGGGDAGRTDPDTGLPECALLITAYAFCAGVFFAIVIGIPVGILMGKNRILDELLLPWVNIFLSAPLTALVPVLMVLFGFGTKTVIITTTLFAIWIIILNARAGVRQINRSLVEMARSFGASPLDAFVKVYFWAALPGDSRRCADRRDPRGEGRHHRPAC